MEHRGKFKQRTIGFGNLEENKILRAIEGEAHRRRRRSVLFGTNRGIALSTTPTPLDTPVIKAKEKELGKPDLHHNVQEDRRAKLTRWKAEKELQKKIQKQVKQPVFRAGVCHHKLNSPIFLHQSCPTAQPAKKTPVAPRITRATAKRLAAKTNAPSKLFVLGAGGTRNKPVTPNSNLKKTSKGTNNVVNKSVPETSFAPDNHKFKAPDGLPSLPLFGQAALANTEEETKAINTSVYFSPYVVSARGKKASRIEQLGNIEISNHSPVKIQNEEPPQQASEEFKENKEQIAASEEFEENEEKTTAYFRFMTEKEVTRLKALCWDWTIVKSNPDIPEDAQFIINQVIGQTNLLINKKIFQFKKLIIDCETGSGDRVVTCDDLQGFWDMMYMQVEDCDSRFNKLNELQEKNWVEQEEKPITKVVTKKQPAAVTKKKVTSKSSSIRNMILAARKKKMELRSGGVSPAIIITESNNPSQDDSSQLASVKFDGGFFTVDSPRKTVTPKSIRKSVLVPQTPKSLETSKHRHSALSCIKVSQLLKPLEIPPLEVELDPVTIPYINFRQTPGKGILKRLDACESASHTKKSQNKVNFDKTEDQICNKNISFLGKTQDKTMNSEIECNIKKRLDFLGLDSSDSDLEVKEANKIQQNDIPGPSNHETNRQSLNTTRVTRKSQKSSLNKLQDKTVLEATNTETNILEKSNMENEVQKENQEPEEKTENIKNRRSARKSVKFTGEECTACSNTKPVHPMTPHVTRRISRSLKKEKTDKSSMGNIESPEDLISWEPVSEPPPRVRRSLRIQNTKQ